jgi:hypothetical protein
MTLLFYGLLPRALILAWLSWRRRHAHRHLLLDHPQVRALLDRMETPLVVHETPDAAREAPTAAPPDAGVRLAPGGATVLIWNGALAPPACLAWLQSRFSLQAGTLLELGSWMGRRAQDEALASLRGGSDARLVVVTKGWEPPLLEFLDLIDALRERVGAERSITVVPVDTAGAEVRRGERDVWAATLARRGDPALYVVEATAGAATAGGELTA